MAKPRLKTTPFFRFLVFLIIVGPATYIGASYINGEDGIQNIKNLVGIGTASEKPPTAPVKEIDFSAKIDDYQQQIKALELELEQKNKKIEVLEAALEEK